MTPDSPDLSYLAQDLRIAVGRIGRRFRQLYAEEGTSSDLAFTEMSVLLRLDREGPTSPGLLADVEHVTPQAVGSVVSALEAEGLLTRSRDPSDGRKITVEITDVGRRALDERARTTTKYLERVLEDDLNPKERAQMAAALPLLERIADRF
jgi:DNA-binding MarR family transcriptional regulator